MKIKVTDKIAPLIKVLDLDTNQFIDNVVEADDCTGIYTVMVIDSINHKLTLDNKLGNIQLVCT